LLVILNGAARLAEGDAAAVEAMRAIVQTDTSWRVPASARLARYYDRIGDRAGAHRWASLLERAEEAEMRACQLVCDSLVSGECSPTTRPASLIEVVRAACAADPTLTKAWLVTGKIPSEMVNGAALQVDALILVVYPFDSMQRPYDVDAIKTRHHQVLNDLIEPNALAVVISFYATEPLPSLLRKTLEQMPVSSTVLLSPHLLSP